ncbi:MAG: Calx-beta domain-containing protein [Geminicoccaceae bacterium]
MLPVICVSLEAWAGQRYTVQKCDTLSALSDRFYNDRWGWRLIYRANRDQVFDGGNLVEAGTVLIIPDRPEGLNAAINKGRSTGDDGRISMARSTTLLLDGGQAFFGTVAGATADDILIRRGVRTFRIDVDQVKEVRLVSTDGGVIAGELLNWSDGVFDLRSNNFRLNVRDGEIISARVLSEGDVSAPIKTLPLANDVVIGDTPIIRLNNGKQIKGYVVDFKENELTVRRGSRGSNRIKFTDIGEVQIPTPDNDLVTGELVDWADGTYRLQVGDRIVVARESVVPLDPAPTVVADLDTVPTDGLEIDRAASPGAAVEAEPEAALPGRTPGPAPRADRVQTAAERRLEQGNGTRGREVVSIQSVRTSPGVRSAPVADSVDVADTTQEDVGFGGDLIPITQLVPEDDDAIFVKAIALPARESDEALRFEINLSRAADQKLVIVYASVNGTATSGLDYEKNFGVLDIEPGKTSATIDLLLLDDTQAEPDESVHLFISPDPSRARVETRDIIGLIQDDDS